MPTYKYTKRVGSHEHLLNPTLNSLLPLLISEENMKKTTFDIHGEHSRS